MSLAGCIIGQVIIAQIWQYPPMILVYEMIATLFLASLWSVRASRRNKRIDD